MKDVKDLILKHVLANALEYNGKAQPQAIIGKLIADNPDVRSELKEIMPEIKNIVKEVNSWSAAKQKKELEKFGAVKKDVKKTGGKRKEGELPDLPNVGKGKVVMRLAPYPSGPLHIGNARMVILNDEYVKKYSGKLILFFDDTIGSEKKMILPEAYEMIEASLKWLGVKWHQVMYKSDRMEIYYKHAEEILKRDAAYVCTCSETLLRNNRRAGVECPCRNNTIDANLKFWKMMLTGEIKEGEAVIRLKTDMHHPNPAFRDRVLLRVVERDHPRIGKKYHVWPMLEFSWAIDDYLLGITHILRGKQLVIEDMMEEFIWQAFGWQKKSEFVHHGMLIMEGVKISKTESRKKIAAGELSGWDDPRTWSMQSLEKRGIHPGAVRKFILDLGMSLADVAMPLEIFYAENRKIIDAEANRYFAVFDPFEISIKSKTKIKLKNESAKAKLHPDFPKRGYREIPVNLEKIFVNADDFKRFHGKEIGLMNLFDVKLKKDAEFVGSEVKMDVQKIHWVSEPSVPIKLIMPDGSVKLGIGEPDIAKVRNGAIIQLVRVGFARVGKINKDIVLYYAHK
jgi:glutamyl-tRNA synthetase